MTRVAYVIFLCIWFFSDAALAEKTDAPADKGIATGSPQKEMEGLAELSLKIAMDALRESGQVYPFAQLVYGKEGKDIRTLGKLRGSKIEPPDVWARHLLETLRNNTDDPELRVTSLTKLHEAQTKDGQPVKGIWILVDHREKKPYVVFLPLLKQPNGKYKTGEVISSPTDESVFPPPSR